MTNRFFPASAIDEIVPVGNEIADGTSCLAEGDATIHATGTLLAKFLLGKILIDLEPVVDALGDRPAWGQLARVIHETGSLTHVAPARRAPEPIRAGSECKLAGCGPRPVPF